MTKNKAAQGDEAKLTITLMGDLSGAINEDDFKRRLQAITERLGFEQFMAGIEWRGPAGDLQYHISSGYSLQWQSHYAKNKLIERDPTVGHCQNSTEPLIWREEPFAAAGSMDILEDARFHGIGHGVSVGAHGRGRIKSMLSLARDQSLEADPRERAELLASAQVLASCAHITLLSIVEPKMGSAVGCRVTHQEREVIRWVAAGKTSWEIGRIMCISEATVAFHVKNAVAKLDVRNRSQMVAVAMRAGLIS